MIHSKNNTVYYQGVYWNNYKPIQQYLNQLCTTSSNIFWADYIKLQFCSQQPFNTALVPNCGDGHIERMFINKKIVMSAVGTDWSSDLLDKANKQAIKDNLSIEYYKLDTNTANFPDKKFDLIINHAACHHIQYIYFVFYKFYLILNQSNGLFINYDYVGPHRNQYSAHQWESIYKANLSLPPQARQDILSTYAHIPTMLITDPTEAIHSELIKQVFNLFFDTILYRPLNGSIAYPLLTHNKNFASLQDTKLQQELLEQMISADKAYANDCPNSEMFAFFVGRPKDNLLDNNAVEVFRKIQEENTIESITNRITTKYYTDTCMGFLYEHIDRLNNKIKTLENKLCKIKS